VPPMSPKLRAANSPEGVAGAPNPSMYDAMGYEKRDFSRPVIGIANGHSTITPCNSGLQALADAAVAAVREAGGNPQVFGTPTISDGMTMGTEGMKYSLVSRKVIADCIETSVQGQWMDGVLVIGGCDKNMPGGMMGILRCNVPAVYVYGGTIKPGRWKGKDLNIVSVFEAVGEFSRGRMNQADFEGIERNAIPGTGSCGGMYTANTMSSSFEALGMSLLGSSTMANPDAEKRESAADSARVLLEAVRRDIKPRDIVTRESIENAVSLIMATGMSLPGSATVATPEAGRREPPADAARALLEAVRRDIRPRDIATRESIETAVSLIMATGGSTNAVLHYLAIAHAAGVEWTID